MNFGFQHLFKDREAYRQTDRRTSKAHNVAYQDGHILEATQMQTDYCDQQIYFGVMISLYSCRSMSEAAAVAPYGMTTLLISKSARLVCRRNASLSEDELADWVRRDGRPGFGLAPAVPRCRPRRPKRRFRLNASVHHINSNLSSFKSN